MRPHLIDITLTLVFVLSMLAVDMVRAGNMDSGMEPVEYSGSTAYWALQDSMCSGNGKYR